MDTHLPASDDPAAPATRRSLRSYALLTIALAATVLIGIVTTFFVVDHTPIWVYWAIGLGFLWVVDFAYAIALVSSLAALPLVILGLKRSPRRRAWMRLGLLAGSVLIGAVVLEGASVLILARQGRTSVMPAGGTESSRGERLIRGRIPDAVEEVELPTTFPDQEDRVSIAVVGESSAAGVPYDRWLSIGKVVAWGLGQAIPGRKFQPEVLAQSGETLELQHQNLASLKHRPDVLIVYCGHNEFSARIPHKRDLAYYADADEPGPVAALATNALAWSSFHALVRRNIEKCRIAIPPPANGHRALVDVPAYTDDEYERLLADFRRRLEAVAAYAEKLGVILVLIAPPGNDSASDPNRSYLPPETPRAERQAIERAYLAAKALEATDPSAAIQGYREVLKRAPGFAAAHWRLARLLATRGDAAEAYEHAVVARDHDGYPQRILTAFQEAYRETARRHAGIFIDGQSYFHAVSPDGLLDDRLFHDAMHPSYRGQLALAQAVLRGLHARRAFGWPADAPEPVIDPAACAQHFGIDPGVWRYLCLWGMMSYEITGPASYDPTLRRLKYEAFARAADAIQAGTAPEAVGLANIGRLEPIPIVPYGGPATSARP
ncbi:hypothetical protein [Paludisphaera mucosa]|uniref:SGNH hydrolase-type esterase domain-containing protein n=1 Tax=Paludisphaera mucosa TaxID=3030827 RepID=A0ABT6FDW5_9BACT|nr:hypothetical protein [Paludisphaera mucosa]MDG3005767.1 hypothetical protein [Paludisphaera mucosa]